MRPCLLAVAGRLVRRREWALLATLAAAAFVYALSRPFAQIHVEAKALAVLAPAVMLVTLRWLLGPGMTYEDAGKRYAPFNRIQAPDENARRALATLARNALAAGRPFVCTVNNNAEGCAPLSIAALARAIAG